MPLSLTDSIFALCALAAVGAAVIVLTRPLDRAGSATALGSVEPSHRITEIVWALVPLLILAVALVAVLPGGNG